MSAARTIVVVFAAGDQCRKDRPAALAQFRARVAQRILTGFTAPEVNHLRSLLDRMIENGQPGQRE